MASYADASCKHMISGWDHDAIHVGDYVFLQGWALPSLAGTTERSQSAGQGLPSEEGQAQTCQLGKKHSTC